MKKHAFTLIELLIVVAIIAILAAIAVPNFLEAQTRAKTSRVKSDQRALSIAIESYAVDWDHYPACAISPNTNPLLGKVPVTITTPLAYITMLPVDVFIKADDNPHPDPDKQHPNPLRLFEYTSQESWIARFGSDVWVGSEIPDGIKWILAAVGPDGYTEVHEPGINAWHGNFLEFISRRDDAVGVDGWYDPTNGTISRGDMLAIGPGPRFEFPGEIVSAP